MGETSGCVNRLLGLRYVSPDKCRTQDPPVKLDLVVDLALAAVGQLNLDAVVRYRQWRPHEAWPVVEAGVSVEAPRKSTYPTFGM